MRNFNKYLLCLLCAQLQGHLTYSAACEVGNDYPHFRDEETSPEKLNNWL